MNTNHQYTPGMARRNWPAALAIALALYAIVAGPDLLNHDSESEASATPGQAKVLAPDFTLSTPDGKKITLSKLRGSWVFVNFWATWCGPCVVEMPSLNNFYRMMKKENLKVLAVSIDTTGPDAVREFAASKGLDFPVLLDGKGEVAASYGVTGIPFTVVVSPEGYVEAKADGAREWDDPEMIQFFRDLMKGTVQKTVRAD